MVTNGCSDDTADRARQVPGAIVVELVMASKTAALNAGDDRATCWPRLYLDADIEITPTAVERVLTLLADGSALAARPAYRYDLTGANRVVRSYYRARQRIPESDKHLWGAGAYAVSKAGHDRLGRFPDVTADDMFVDSLFAPEEIAIVDTEPVRVRTPRDVPSLMAILRRTYSGNAEIASTYRDHPPRRRRTTTSTARGLIAATAGPVVDSVVYLGLVSAGRIRAPGRTRTNGSGTTAADRPTRPASSAG